MKHDVNKTTVCILFGGKSVEHDISIITAFQVKNALDLEKYNVEFIYLTKDNKMLRGKSLENLDTYKENNFKKVKEVYIKNINNLTYLIQKHKKILIDIFIPVFHGEGCEDGTISALLDFYNATYVTSSLTTSAIFQDKVYTKDILKSYNIKTPKYITFNKYDDKDKINQELAYPIIIKPSRLGSSIGIKKVNQKEDLDNALNEAFSYSNRLIIEEVINKPKELNCAAFLYKDLIYTSNIEEVNTNNEFLTFNDKYENNEKLENNNRIIPANISPSLKKQIYEVTKVIYKLFDAKGVIRIDYLYDENENNLYVNEVNTIPGSYAFYLYEKENISFSVMLDMIIRNAFIEKVKENKLIKIFDTNILTNKSMKLNK